MIETITIIGLILVIGMLLVERYYVNKNMREERKEWTKGMLAKSLRELTDNEALEKIPEEKPFVAPDTISMDDAIEDEELFDRHIEAVKKQAQEEFDKEHEVK